MTKRYRVDISPRSKYYLSKHRSLELIHFCYQYPEWKQAYKAIREVSVQSKQLSFLSTHRKNRPNPTEELAVKLAHYSNLIDMIEKTCFEAAPDISTYLLLDVTDPDISYEVLRNTYEMPCGKDKYYECRRRFFWMLDRKRG